MFFVFGALIEFAVVNYYSRHDKETKKRRRLQALHAGLADFARQAAEGNEFNTNFGDKFGSTRLHRRRNTNRASSRKKFESGKDSGIESDDLEEVIATRYVKSLGATKLSNHQHKNSLSNAQQENMPLTAGHRDSLGNYSNYSNPENLPPPAQYANTSSPSSLANFKKQQSLLSNQLNNNQLNNRTSFSSNQPVYRNTNAFSEQTNDNGQTNFVNLVVDSQAKTNAVRVKKSGNFFSNWLNRFPTTSKRIDVLSRIFFPLLFAMFNVFYWVTYLFRDDLQK